MIEKRRSFCKGCKKETFNKQSKTNRMYASNSKSGLCQSCAAKKRYKERCQSFGAFTNKRAVLWNKEEIEFLLNNYSKGTKEELKNKLNRNWSSIVHKAMKFKLKRDTRFLIEGNKKGMDYFRYNNPMYNKEITTRVGNILKEKWNKGEIQLSGIALRSHLGLIKKENHPNWLGGISFEPYDKNWDDSFKIEIKKRDNFTCQICNKEKNVLCIHHIDYDKKNTSRNNCISLCSSCHPKTNYNRSSWINFFKLKMEDIPIVQGM